METGERISSNENPENIERLNEGYRSLQSYLSKMVLIDTTPFTPQEVLGRCWEEVKKALSDGKKDR